MEIKVGQLWKVNSNYFMAYPKLNKRVPELIQIETKFKIIHPEEWHFTIGSDKIFFAKPHEILEHCICLTEDKIDMLGIINPPKRKIKGAHPSIKYKKSIKI